MMSSVAGFVVGLFQTVFAFIGLVPQPTPMPQPTQPASVVQQATIQNNIENTSKTQLPSTTAITAGAISSSSTGGFYEVSRSACPSSSGPISTTVTRSSSLPDGATVTNIGNGQEQYKNPKYDFSFDFPANLNVQVVVQGATGAYNAAINAAQASQNALVVQLDDENDCVQGQQFRGTPPPHPSTGTQTITAGGAEFLLWDNVADAQTYDSDNFEVEAASSNEVTAVPGDSYSLEFNYRFTAASDEQMYLNVVRQVVASVNLL